VPVVDARRREVFVVEDGTPRVAAPADLRVAAGATYVGNGAVRYRSVLEAAGAIVPPDGDERHLPRARFHAALAAEYGPAEAVEPMYLRLPDVDRTVP
jgi:tRNA A37 threonylcarbamoyladenosine modification protein TsaB